MFSNRHAPDRTICSELSGNSRKVLYEYIRRTVTTANEAIAPLRLTENDVHFGRVVDATDAKGRRLVSVDPRSVEWYFGCDGLPRENELVCFGNRVYLNAEYSAEDPELTALMVSALVRIDATRKAGGELRFAAEYGMGDSKSLRRRSESTVAAWRTWWADHVAETERLAESSDAAVRRARESCDQFQDTRSSKRAVTIRPMSDSFIAELGSRW